METTYRRIAVWSAVVCLLTAGYGLTIEADGPQERVRLMLNSLRSVLADETLKTPGQRQELRDRIHRILEQHIDFQEMARRSLGQHWFKITPTQQHEYLVIFSQMIEQSFVNRIAYRGEPSRKGYGSVPDAIQYTQETIDSAGYAAVQTAMTYPGELAREEIAYLLIKRNGRWWIYDMVAEEASTITNYRTQFDTIIRQETFAGLMQRLQMSAQRREHSSSN